ncbi:UNVERIFIED_CONTAM: TetR family transcriptional regulator [Mumia flava]|nr:TetR/AcrR family transcriptional regulator [Mumia flava]
MRSKPAILAATVSLIEAGGFDAVTISAVAKEAGVTRQTVYSNVGTLEDLVSEAMIGVATESLAEVREVTAATRTARAFVVELIVASRRVVRERPVLARLLVPDAGNPVFDRDMMARALPVARATLAPITERSPGLVRHLDEIAEVVVRLALSVLMFDSAAVRSDEDLRSFLERWLGESVTLLDT